MSGIESLLGTYMLFAAPFVEIAAQSAIRKEQLREEYANLQNLPRKKKKYQKKRILSEWQIACYDPLSGGYNLD